MDAFITTTLHTLSDTVIPRATALPAAPPPQHNAYRTQHLFMKAKESVRCSAQLNRGLRPVYEGILDQFKRTDYQPTESQRTRDLFREVMSTSITNRLLPGGLLKGLGGAAGEAGASRALSILSAEIHRTMGVMGLTNLNSLAPDHIVLASKLNSSDCM